MKKVNIVDTSDPNKVKAEPDSLPVSVKVDKEVEWQSSLPDWRVVFGPNAPVDPKVASKARPNLTLKKGRPEDPRHVKYVVVAWTGDRLKHDDPELIVDRRG